MKTELRSNSKEEVIKRAITTISTSKLTINPFEIASNTDKNLEINKLESSFAVTTALSTKPETLDTKCVNNLNEFNINATNTSASSSNQNNKKKYSITSVINSIREQIENEENLNKIKNSQFDQNMAKKSNSNHDRSLSEKMNESSPGPNKYKYTIEYPFKKIKFKDEANLLWNIFTLIISFLFNLTLMIPMSIVTCIILTLKMLFRSTFRLFHICHLTGISHILPDKIPEFLTPLELFWLYNSNLIKKLNSNSKNQVDEDVVIVDQNNNNTNASITSNNNNKSTGACLFFIEGHLPFNKVKDLIQNKIIQVGSRTGERNYERFTQRMYKLYLYGYVWLNCESFNLNEHVIEIDDDENNTSHSNNSTAANCNNYNNNHFNEKNTKIRTNEDLEMYTSKLLSKHEFKSDKPLWAIYYKKGFGPEKLTVLLFVYHMCFSDGISLIRLFLKGIVDNRNEIDIKPRFAYFSFYFDMLKQMFFGWSRIFYHLIFMTKDKNPLHIDHFKSRKYVNLKQNIDINMNKSNEQTTLPLQSSSSLPKQIYTWSEPFDLVAINRLKLVTRCKLNEFLISLVSGIIRNYLQTKGINHPTNLHCLMPVDLSSNKYPFKLCQKSTFASLKMPVNAEGIIPRLWKTRDSISMLKTSSNYLLIYIYKHVAFNLLPNSLAYSLIKSLVNKHTIAASTLGAGDASLATASLCNHNVRNIVYFYPALCDLSVSFSIVTYGEEVRLSLVADSNIITHPKIITNEFIRQLETLNELLSNRRIPGEIKRIIRPLIHQIETGNIDNIEGLGEISTEEMQQKMTEIQQELQFLSETLKNFEQSSQNSEFLKQKQAILIRAESLRKEFRGILLKYQLRQSMSSQALPSDDENELDPVERVRFRSHSIASRASSTSKKNKDSNYENSERQASSRKPSVAAHSRRGSLSYVSGNSNVMENSNVSDHHNNLTIENELSVGIRQGKNNRFGSTHSTNSNNNYSSVISTSTNNVNSHYNNQLSPYHSTLNYLNTGQSTDNKLLVMKTGNDTEIFELTIKNAQS